MATDSDSDDDVFESGSGRNCTAKEKSVSPVRPTADAEKASKLKQPPETMKRAVELAKEGYSKTVRSERARRLC
jgi:hypothetical protein